MMALYRIVEPSEGRILIDGIDIATIGLFDLRSRLALVPQVGACLQPHLQRIFGQTDMAPDASMQ